MTRAFAAATAGLLLAGCGGEPEKPATAAARAQATPTPTPTPTPSPTPTPAPTDTVRLRPAEGERGSGTIEVDRASGTFTLSMRRMERIGRRRAHALWVRGKPGAAPCRLGFIVLARRGAAQAAGQLPKLPAGARFLVTVERTAKPRRPGRLVLRGRAGFPIDSATPAREVCRRP